jgi:pimeloyl-ACP methyl ester carboxylesterase
MCDERLWQGGHGAIASVLARHFEAPVHKSDFAHDDTIMALASRTLASTAGPLLPIGFSMGAIVAVEMWRQSPERIVGMILLGYNATADLPERAARRPLQQAEVKAGGLERVLVDELKPNYLSQQNSGDAALLALLRDMGLSMGPDVFVRQSEALRLRHDQQALLAELSVPVLYGCGQDDVLCPPQWHERWAATTPRADLGIVAGAGHMLPLEAPEALAEIIDQWLDRTEFA